MSEQRLPRVARWFVAISLAGGAVVLTARDGHATLQRLFTEITTSNLNCIADSNGLNYYTFAAAWNSSGNILGQVGGSLGEVDSSGIGTTAEGQMAFNGLTAVHQDMWVISYDPNTNKGGVFGCTQPSNSYPFTQTLSCSFHPPVTGSCPSGTTISGTSFGNNFN